MIRLFAPAAGLVALILAASACDAGGQTEREPVADGPEDVEVLEEMTDADPILSDTRVPEKIGDSIDLADNEAAGMAVFAGGCFWCVEADFEKLDGVTEAISGYAGGDSEEPTYKNYERGGHREVAKIEFDPAVISYDELVAKFFRSVDPTDDGGQFCDRGFGYTTAIHTYSDAQRAAAEAAKAEAEEELGRDIVTPVLGPAEFWPAEDYHQDYYKKNSGRYSIYRRGCGRDARIRGLWGDEAWAAK